MSYPPPLPIDWARACRSGIWSWIFQWLGKSLILKRRFVGRCGIKGIGSPCPYGESQERGDSLSSASSFLQTPFKGGQAPREGQYKAATDAFMLFTLTSADFLTKQDLLLLSFCIVGNYRLNLF